MLFVSASQRGTLRGTGLVNHQVLGFSFTDGQGESGGAFVVRFAADGTFESGFITGAHDQWKQTP